MTFNGETYRLRNALSANIPKIILSLPTEGSQSMVAWSKKLVAEL